MERQIEAKNMVRQISAAREYVKRSAKYCQLIDAPAPFDIEAAMETIGRARTRSELDAATSPIKTAMEYVLLRSYD